jgi:hypothetical protein
LSISAKDRFVELLTSPSKAVGDRGRSPGKRMVAPTNTAIVASQNERKSWRKKVRMKLIR